jgi:hypothetical protein
MKTVFATAAAFVAVSGAVQVAAADFIESEDLPAYNPSGPAVYASASPFTSGLKLDGADLVSNPSGWNDYFTVALDTTAQTITLTSSAFNTFQTASLDITNISEFTITGLSAGSVQDLIGFSTSAMNPVDLSFTGTSIHIGYSMQDLGFGNYFGYGEQTSSVFHYTTTDDPAGVPEPASWAMFIGGFGAIGGAMRSRRKAGVSFA